MIKTKEQQFLARVKADMLEDESIIKAARAYNFEDFRRAISTDDIQDFVLGREARDIELMTQLETDGALRNKLAHKIYIDTHASKLAHELIETEERGL